MKTLHEECFGNPDRLGCSMSQIKRTKYEMLKVLAENLVRITENGEVLWNEGLYLDFLEMIGFCKVRIDGELNFVQKKKSTMVEIDRKQIVYYVLMFLDQIERYDISEFLLDNNVFFSPNLLNMLKEEDPYEFYDEIIEFFDEDGVVHIAQDKFNLHSIDSEVI